MPSVLQLMGCCIKCKMRCTMNSFSEWINKQEFDEETIGLYREGISCYKGEAYRAALMFTFLGFQSMVRERVLLSPVPEGYIEGEWNHIKQELLNGDETWEQQIQSLIKNKKKSPFKLSEDVYEQYIFWKNRRNDCAHAKGNYISYPHVEAFWLFIESNSYKFTVNGGKNYILRELEDHFDIHKTPTGTDILPILVKIPHAVEKKDLTEIFDKMSDITLRDNKYIDDDKSAMWKKMFNYVDIQESLIRYFVDEENSSLVKAVLRKEPNLIKYFNKEDGFIRRLWIKEFSSYLDYYIFIEMVRNSLIPQNQLDEACKKMINSIDSEVFAYNSFLVEEFSEIDFINLQQIGFFKLFYEMAFKDRKIVKSFNWGNQNKDLVCYYIKKYGLDEVMVKAINSSFLTTYNPRHLNSSIVEFYEHNKEIWDEHCKISEKIDDRLPKILVMKED